MGAMIERRMCPKHVPEKAHRPVCPAIKLQGRLKRRGYEAGQYQGIVKTDAPEALLDDLAAKVRNEQPPEFYLSVATGTPQQGGTLPPGDTGRCYTVITPAGPLMASTAHRATAEKVLAAEARRRGVAVPDRMWDGDLGRFVPAEAAR